ncbi:hypothetical protein H4219_003056 [Mycoemilia scoparia]|uniref:Mitogen-activated protein kinase-binding protein 1 n=1 Tax=Mycoemilia scoparia TaxID=417184 RepID=A0A9W8DPS7_9FUNG|nr:hypothetical protein H4219_003056 [Mycoemilia scoparia]
MFFEEDPECPNAPVVTHSIVANSRRRPAHEIDTHSQANLFRVIGNTVSNTNQLEPSPNEPSIVAYAAGCVLVIFDVVLNQSKCHLVADYTRLKPRKGNSKSAEVTIPGNAINRDASSDVDWYSSADEGIRKSKWFYGNIFGKRGSRNESTASLTKSMSGLGFKGHSEAMAKRYSFGGNIQSNGNNIATDDEFSRNSASTCWRVSTKPISCIGFSSDGDYVAVGESGHKPRIIIWDWRDGKIVQEMVGHKAGVACLRFTPNKRFLISLGYQQDGYIYVWNWKTGAKVSSNKVSARVEALWVSPDSSYFVTVGNRHVRFWYLSLGRRPIVPRGETQVLEGRTALLDELRNRDFIDVNICVCRSAANISIRSSSSLAKQPPALRARPDRDHVVYTITRDGMLCLFMNGSRSISKWINVHLQRCSSIMVTSTLVICVGEKNIMRFFEPETLQYLGSERFEIPNHAPIIAAAVVQNYSPYSSDDDGDDEGSSTKNSLMASDIDTQWCHADLEFEMDDVSLNDSKPLPFNLITVDQSHTVSHWNIRPTEYRNPIWSYTLSCKTAFPGHASCIWGVEPFSRLSSSGSIEQGFLTITEDGSIFLWSKSFDGDYNQYARLSNPLSSKGREGGYNTRGIRSIKQSSDRKLLVVGGRHGQVAICNISYMSGKVIVPGSKCPLHVIALIEAHEGDVMSVDIHYCSNTCVYWIASSGRDRRIHIYKLFESRQKENDNGPVSPKSEADAVKQDFKLQFVQTIEDHSSSINSVLFVAGGTRLVSCGADKSIIFRILDSEVLPRRQSSNFKQRKGSGQSPYTDGLGIPACGSPTTSATNSSRRSASGTASSNNIASAASSGPFSLLQNYCGRSSIHGMVYEPTAFSNILFAVTQDRHVLLFDVASGKLIGDVKVDPSERLGPRATSLLTLSSNSLDSNSRRQSMGGDISRILDLKNSGKLDSDRRNSTAFEPLMTPSSPYSHVVTAAELLTGVQSSRPQPTPASQTEDTLVSSTDFVPTPRRSMVFGCNLASLPSSPFATDMSKVGESTTHKSSPKNNKTNEPRGLYLEQKTLPSYSVSGISLHPRAKLIALSCSDKCVRVLNIVTGEMVAAIRGHSELLTGISFIDLGDRDDYLNNKVWLITTSGDQCAMLWKIHYKRSQNSRQSLTPSSSKFMVSNIVESPLAAEALIEYSEESDVDEAVQNVNIIECVNVSTPEKTSETVVLSPSAFQVQMIKSLNSKSPNSGFGKNLKPNSIKNSLKKVTQKSSLPALRGSSSKADIKPERISSHSGAIHGRRASVSGDTISTSAKKRDNIKSNDTQDSREKQRSRVLPPIPPNIPPAPKTKAIDGNVSSASFRRLSTGKGSFDKENSRLKINTKVRNGGFSSDSNTESKLPMSAGRAEVRSHRKAKTNGEESAHQPKSATNSKFLKRVPGSLLSSSGSGRAVRPSSSRSSLESYTERAQQKSIMVSKRPTTSSSSVLPIPKNSTQASDIYPKSNSSMSHSSQYSQKNEQPSSMTSSAGSSSYFSTRGQQTPSPHSSAFEELQEEEDTTKELLSYPRQNNTSKVPHPPPLSSSSSTHTESPSKLSNYSYSNGKIGARSLPTTPLRNSITFTNSSPTKTNVSPSTTTTSVSTNLETIFQSGLPPQPPMPFELQNQDTDIISCLVASKNIISKAIALTKVCDDTKENNGTKNVSSTALMGLLQQIYSNLGELFENTDRTTTTTIAVDGKPKPEAALDTKQQLQEKSILEKRNTNSNSNDGQAQHLLEHYSDILLDMVAERLLNKSRTAK